MKISARRVRRTKRPQEHRKFAGKTYWVSGSWRTKSLAQADARYRRSEGYSARVVPIRMGMFAKPRVRWAVYVRRKK